MKVIITIPAYNEENTLGTVLQEIHEVMKQTKYNYKVLVVDDGSVDKTAEIAKNNKAKVVSHSINYGLATTFKTEIKECLKDKADIIVHTDADGQYPADKIPELIEQIKQGQSLVLGSRFLGKIESMPLMKRLGNVAFSKAISKIARVRITDAQTGFRAFTKDVAKLDIISNHTYTQEQIIRVAKNKLKIKEVPIYAKKTRPSRLMKSPKIIQPFEYAVKAWTNLFRIYRDFEPLKFFGYFGGAFLFIGLVVGTYLSLMFLLTGRVGQIPATILSALLIMTGVQIILFGFLADMKRPG